MHRGNSKLPSRADQHFHYQEWQVVGRVLLIITISWAASMIQAFTHTRIGHRVCILRDAFSRWGKVIAHRVRTVEVRWEESQAVWSYWKKIHSTCSIWLMRRDPGRGTQERVAIAVQSHTVPTRHWRLAANRAYVSSHSLGTLYSLLQPSSSDVLTAHSR